ncbi:hypothetical protein [Leucobacter chromiireducens]|uniref:hypothetical protein n=1 Tax=Leucobacter chromiireducens TaxID=283877 RepID=UPI000F630B90|nr:hypothetical protein [Leucobacter chromiireducens]
MITRTSRRAVLGVFATTAALAFLAGGLVSSTSAAYTDAAHAKSEPLTAKIEVPFATGLAPGRSVDTGVGLGSDGNAYVWGRTDMKMAGSNAGGTFQNTTQVGGLPAGETAAVTGGIYNFNALQQDGHVWGWGMYPSRDGTEASRPDNRAERVRIGSAWNGGGELLEDIAVISSTEMAGAGIRTDGTVWAWGSNSYGGLGGTGATQVPGLPDPIVNDGERFPVSLHGAYRNFWVILNNGEVWYWGSTSSTPAGDAGSTGGAVMSQALSPWFKSNVPAGQAFIVSVAGGINMGHAVLSDGTVLTWGSNATRIGGRPAGGGAPAAASPGLVPSTLLSGITRSVAGFTGAALLDSAGNLYGYGASDDYGGFPQTSALIDTEVSQVLAGQGFYIWAKSNGEYWGQGYNPAGATGRPTGAALRKITSVDFSVFH